MRVGLLEDDIAIQEMLLLVLQDEGHTVVNYSTAEECLEAFNGVPETQIPVDLMIVDWRLSGPISGIEVIKQLRANVHLQSLPVILTTAATFNDTEALRDLQVALLEKPFSVDDMLALIKDLTQSPPVV
jgi:DNA-binding response OmpR family regulator